MDASSLLIGLLIGSAMFNSGPEGATWFAIGVIGTAVTAVIAGVSLRIVAWFDQRAMRKRWVIEARITEARIRRVETLQPDEVILMAEDEFKRMMKQNLIDLGADGGWRYLGHIVKTAIPVTA